MSNEHDHTPPTRDGEPQRPGVRKHERIRERLDAETSRADALSGRVTALRRELEIARGALPESRGEHYARQLEAATGTLGGAAAGGETGALAAVGRAVLCELGLDVRTTSPSAAREAVAEMREQRDEARADARSHSEEAIRLRHSLAERDPSGSIALALIGSEVLMRLDLDPGETKIDDVGAELGSLLAERDNATRKLEGMIQACERAHRENDELEQRLRTVERYRELAESRAERAWDLIAKVGNLVEEFAGDLVQTVRALERERERES